MRDNELRRVRENRIQEREKLRTPGFIQSVRWLVGNQKLRTARDGCRDTDALSHSAAELFWIILDAVGCDADLLQQLSGILHGLLAAHAAMHAQYHGNLFADCENGIQSGQGILKDHGDLIAALFADLTTLDWVCKLMGLRYPDDIALLGYALEDDVLSATSRLSVISYPLEEMCNTALSLLMARIAGEPNLPEPPVMKQIPASLIIRDSTILRF